VWTRELTLGRWIVKKQVCIITGLCNNQLQDCVPGDTPPDLCFLGNRKTPLVKVSKRGEDESSLFSFSFSECSLMDQFRVTSVPDETGKVTRATLSGLEEACNLYFQERFVNCCSVLHNWSTNIFMWMQLKEIFS